MFRVDSLVHGGSATFTLGLRVLERELYLRFIYLPIYPSIASEGNGEGMNTVRKGESRKEILK